jgi:hypothetical protein
VSVDRQYLSLVLVGLVFLTVAAPSKGAVFDGQWWLSVDQRQRDGFVYGFVVCYSNLVDRKLFQESYRAYATRLNGYLQAHPESLAEPVESTLRRVASPPFAKPVQRASVPNETPKESAAKWGANNDGDEWRGATSWNLGYVQGFLQCYSRHTKSEYGTFSKAPEWYANAIANWYGVKADDPEEINVSRRNEKIPEVLFRFRDKPEAK